MKTVSPEFIDELIDFAPTEETRKMGFASGQRDGTVALFNMLQRNKVAYLADEVGMGKTYVALGVMALVRYFDPQRQRAGMPEGVGALVERLEVNSTTVALDNTDQVAGREVIVQGGAYAEHCFGSVRVGEDSEVGELEGSAFAVRLAPGAGAKLEIATRRYSAVPTFAFPCDRS